MSNIVWIRMSKTLPNKEILFSMKETIITTEQIKHQLANLRQLCFEVTDACNLQCKYCAYGELYNDYDTRECKTLSVSTAIKLIDYLAELWNSKYNTSEKSHVYIGFYGGEPLVNMPFIKAIVSYIEKLNCRNREFTFSMTTNALLLKHNMDFLVEHRFNLLISLDGNEYNTSYRVDKKGRPAYSKILENVYALREKYPDFFEEKVNFNAVLHNRNSIADIYDFFKKHFDKVPSIGELNNMGIRPDKVDLFRETYRNYSESLHQTENYEAIEQDMFIRSATYQSLTTFVHQHSGFVYSDYTDLLFGPPKKTIPTGTCIPFSRKLFVTVNGKILPCERIGQQFGLGKISETGIELNIEAIADRYNNYFAKLKPQCQKCYNYNTCIQCVYNLPNIDKQPVCHGFMNKKQYEEYKARQIDFLRQHPDAYHRIMEEVILR